MAMKKWGGVDPYPGRRWHPRQVECGDLTFAKNAGGLEKLFPGCSIAWDVNPATRSWPYYTLTIRPHHPDQYMPPYSRDSKEAHHHARLWGYHVLLAIKKKDGIVQHDSFKIEWRESRSTFHVTRRTDTGELEMLDDLTRARGGQWSAYRDRIAWYVPQEERWTVIQ